MQKKEACRLKEDILSKGVPIFYPVFIAALNSITTVIGVLPESGFTAFYSGSFVTAMKMASAKFFIAMAMCAIGLNTNLIDLVKGGKPIAAGFACWVMDFSCFHSGTAGNRNFFIQIYSTSGLQVA